MRKLFSLAVAGLLNLSGCEQKTEASASALPACRVKLPPSYSALNRESARAPQIISTFSLSGLRGAQSTYQLFWLQNSGLYREQRSQEGVRDESPVRLAPRVTAFHATNYQEQALVAYAQRRDDKHHLFVSFGNSEDAFLRKIQTSEVQPIESLAIAAQGLTAVIIYTAQTTEGLKAFTQTINLCPFSDDDEIRQQCYAPALDQANAETQEVIWEVPEKNDPVSVGKANVLSRGALSITPLRDNEFVVSFEDASGQKKAYQLSLTEESQPVLEREQPLLPEARHPLPGVMPLVQMKANGEAYAFYSQGAPLTFSVLDGQSKSIQAKLSTKDALRSYASVLAYRNDNTTDDFAALWFGTGPLQRGNKQLSFARLALDGALREAPLWVLPGEEISAASMAALERDSLQFGVFYQHEDSEVGLGFVQIDCSDRLPSR